MIRNSFDYRFTVYLYKPLIPQNTGNIGRLCLGFGTRLTLIGQLGFSLDGAARRRAGLDYWSKLQFNHIENAASWLPPERCFTVSKYAEHSIFDNNFRIGDSFLFGQETKGLPIDFRQRSQAFHLPMNPAIRSFNLANSVAMVLLEATRQVRERNVRGLRQ